MAREVSKSRSSRGLRGSWTAPTRRAEQRGEQTTVDHVEAMHQMSNAQFELPLATRGEAPTRERSGEADATAHEPGCSGRADLMEQIVARGNLMRALKRVRANQGSAGVDGVTVNDLPDYLREHWKGIREQLLTGHYQPSAVRRVEIPKPGGGVRRLGIPTVLDRFIQQAVLQVLQPRIDPTFSEHSYGFRPGRSAHQAVCQAQRHVQAGRCWVVDVDLEQFFDRVNHDLLMGRVAKHCADARVLRLIRRYLEAGMMAEGMVTARHEGTPQGGPLSPLLANVLLDDVDKELEQRGLPFVRYADDCNVYVQSQRAAERVMEGLIGLYANLKLRVNAAKSAVAPVWARSFLGFSFWRAPGKIVKCRVSPKALITMQERVRAITARTGGRSVVYVATELRKYLTGWKAYFRLAETPRVLADVDKWIHRRLRALILRQWKCGRTAYRELRRRGVGGKSVAITAHYTRHWWRASKFGAMHLAFPGAYFDSLGVPRLGAPRTSTH